MKHSPDIQAKVSRAYSLRLAPSAFDLPEIAVDWPALPERFFEGIDFASRHVGNNPSSPNEEFIRFVHVADGKAYATDNIFAVEYDLGEQRTHSYSLAVKGVRLLKAFGSPPSHGSVGPRPLFRWTDGRALSLAQGRSDDGKIKAILDKWQVDDLHEVDAIWRGQIVGHFSFNPVPGDDGLLEVVHDRIACGVFDGQSNTELRIETYSDRPLVFSKGPFLAAIKVATAIKYVHRGKHTCLVFRADNVRGVVASRHRVGT